MRYATRTMLALVSAVLLLAAGLAAQRNDSAQALLRAATDKAVVDGDLTGAIKQYQTIVDKFRTDRAIVAQALVRMAECYQKLGDAEAQKIYERIVREFADQKEAVATARARLDIGASPVRGAGDRAVWIGPKVDMFGQVSPDGRFITYVDWGGDQNLMVHNVMANSDRPLTATGPSIGFSQFAEFSTISRDGKQVAYAWYNDKGLYDLRIVPLQGSTVPEPRRFFLGSDDMQSIAPLDWSPDGKWIAVNVRRKDGTGQIGLVAVADGSLRVLKSVDWRGANKIVFSPDGRFIAYDIAAGDSDAERTIYVMAVDGSRESALAVHPSQNVVMAWPRDHVLFASDRSGTISLWAQLEADGKPLGGPTLIKRDIGSSWSLGLTSSGTLYVYKGPSANYVQVASLDLSAGTIGSAPRGSLQRFAGYGGTPRWSRDGRRLAYKSCGLGPRAICTIEVAAAQTGEVRKVPTQLSYLGDLQFALDERSFLAIGSDFKGRRGLFRVAGQTGELSFLLPRPGAIEQWAPDEKKIYYRRGGSVVERDVATGAERELFSQKAVGNNISIKVSPDGRNIAAVEYTATTFTLYLIPIAGGTPKELLHAKTGQRFDGYRLEWTPDSGAVVLPTWTQTVSDRVELWLVPVNDPGKLRKLDVNTENWILPGGGFAIHPDGRQIAFVAAAGKQGAEVWALENFLPVLNAKR